MKQEETIGFRVDANLKEKLRILARKDLRTLSGYCRKVLEEKVHEVQASTAD